MRQAEKFRDRRSLHRLELANVLPATDTAIPKHAADVPSPSRQHRAGVLHTITIHHSGAAAMLFAHLIAIILRGFAWVNLHLAALPKTLDAPPQVLLNGTALNSTAAVPSNHIGNHTINATALVLCDGSVAINCPGNHTTNITALVLYDDSAAAEVLSALSIDILLLASYLLALLLVACILCSGLPRRAFAARDIGRGRSRTRQHSHQRKRKRLDSSPPVGTKLRRPSDTIGQEEDKAAGDFAIHDPINTNKDSTQAVAPQPTRPIYHDSNIQADLPCLGCETLQREIVPLATDRDAVLKTKEQLAKSTESVKLREKAAEEITSKQRGILFQSQQVCEGLAQEVGNQRLRAENAERKLAEIQKGDKSSRPVVANAKVQTKGDNSSIAVSTAPATVTQTGTQTEKDSSVVAKADFEKEEAKHKDTTESLAAAQREIADLKQAKRSAEESATQERKNAEGQQKRADKVEESRNKEKLRADGEKDRADGEKDRANSEQKRADEAENSQDDEKTRADDEKNRADSGCKRADAAEEARKSAESKAAEAQRLRAEAEKERDKAIEQNQKTQHHAKEARESREDCTNLQTHVSNLTRDLDAAQESVRQNDETAQTAAQEHQKTLDQLRRRIEQLENAATSTATAWELEKFEYETVVSEKDERIRQLEKSVNASQGQDHEMEDENVPDQLPYYGENGQPPQHLPLGPADDWMFSGGENGQPLPNLNTGAADELAPPCPRCGRINGGSGICGFCAICLPCGYPMTDGICTTERCPNRFVLDPALAGDNTGPAGGPGPLVGNALDPQLGGGVADGQVQPDHPTGNDGQHPVPCRNCREPLGKDRWCWNRNCLLARWAEEGMLDEDGEATMHGAQLFLAAHTEPQQQPAGGADDQYPLNPPNDFAPQNNMPPEDVGDMLRPLVPQATGQEHTINNGQPTSGLGGVMDRQNPNNVIEGVGPLAPAAPNGGGGVDGRPRARLRQSRRGGLGAVAEVECAKCGTVHPGASACLHCAAMNAMG